MNLESHAPSILILGAGVTGASLARAAVSRGLSVVLVDVDQRALDRAQADFLRAGLSRQVAAGLLRTGRSVQDGAGAGLVIEAVTEKAVVKTKALTAACQVVAPGTALVSCSLAIPVDEIADWAGRPQDVVGAHFTHPAFPATAVEYARGPRTADAAVAALGGLARSLGLALIEVRDGPGLLGTRVCYQMINSAARALESGLGRAESIDGVLCECFGHTVGPLRAADLIGIDSLVNTLQEIYNRTGEETCNPCELLLDKVRAGELGRKSGRGFYTYDKV